MGARTTSGTKFKLSLRETAVVTSDRGRAVFTVLPRDLIAAGVCDAENATYVADFVSAYISLLADSPLHSPKNLKPLKLYRAFIRDISSRPIRDFIGEYSQLGDALMVSGHLTGGSTITGEFIDSFRGTPVFREYHEWFKTGNPLLLTYLLTFCRFGKKLHYVDETLNTTAFRGWKALEEKLLLRELPSNITDLRKIARALLPPLRTEPWIPHHGPGRVADKGVSSISDKNRVLSYDRRLQYAFSRPAFKHFEEWSFENARRAMSTFPGYDMLPEASDMKHHDANRTSVLRFVPKDVRKSRSICMEPTTLMAYQQLVRHWIYTAIGEGPLRAHVILHDQEANRSGAVHGSIYGSVDTIDLTSASDSVGLDLVRSIFPREYLFYLLSTRSDSVVLPDGSTHRMAKFAPMGSALCFPTQCIIFATVVVYAMMYHDRVHGREPFEVSIVRDPDDVLQFLRRHVYHYYSENTPFSHKYERFLVFGDDIICDSRVTGIVTQTLTDLGFTVNVGKSFQGSQAFRESCGVFAFNGDTVTPFSYTVKGYGDQLNGSAFASLIDAANRAGDFGYFNLRSRLIRVLRQRQLKIKGLRRLRKYFVDGNPVLFTEDRNQMGIYTTHARNAHLFMREQPRPAREDKPWYQRTEYFVVRPYTPSPSVDRTQVDDGYLYVQDMGARTKRDTYPDFVFGMRLVRPEETGIRGGWTSLW